MRDPSFDNTGRRLARKLEGYNLCFPLHEKGRRKIVRPFDRRYVLCALAKRSGGVSRVIARVSGGLGRQVVPGAFVFCSHCFLLREPSNTTFRSS